MHNSHSHHRPLVHDSQLRSEPALFQVIEKKFLEGIKNWHKAVKTLLFKSLLNKLYISHSSLVNLTHTHVTQIKVFSLLYIPQQWKLYFFPLALIQLL